MKLFLQKQKLPKPQGVTMEPLNKLISIKEMESITNNLPQKTTSQGFHQ
jgi:hypothetical protein